MTGLDFWRNHDKKSQKYTRDDQRLYTRPMTSDNAQKPAQSGTVDSNRRSRRFSMSEFLSRDTFLGNSQSDQGSVKSTTRFFDFARNRSLRQKIQTQDHRPRERSRIRNALTLNLSNSSRRQRDSIDSILSLPPPNGLGTPDQPFMHFRGGASWKCLETDAERLGLDLFWPVNTSHDNDYDEEDCANDMLDVEELMPLCAFRNLRVLKITGMTQSYQKYIWQAVWLNVNLEELELGMVLEPCVRRGFSGDWPFIKGGWRMRDAKGQAQHGGTVYHGDNGTGMLNRKIGIGEYLDKLSIEQAKLRALTLMQGPVSRRLPIRRITLTGFVVDADPFLLWFDPDRLERIDFKDDCVDAGFYLPTSMHGSVTVSYPGRIQDGAIAVPIRRVDLREELKLVDLQEGKKVGQVPYFEKKKPPPTRKASRWRGRGSKKNENSNNSTKTVEANDRGRSRFRRSRLRLPEQRPNPNPNSMVSEDSTIVTGSLCNSQHSHCLPTTFSNSSDGSILDDAEDDYKDYPHGKSSDEFNWKTPDTPGIKDINQEPTPTTNEETNHSNNTEPKDTGTHGDNDDHDDDDDDNNNNNNEYTLHRDTTAVDNVDDSDIHFLKLSRSLKTVTTLHDDSNPPPLPPRRNNRRRHRRGLSLAGLKPGK